MTYTSARDRQTARFFAMWSHANTQRMYYHIGNPANYSDYTPHLRRGVVEAIRKLREIERAH